MGCGDGLRVGMCRPGESGEIQLNCVCVLGIWGARIASFACGLILDVRIGNDVALHG